VAPPDATRTASGSAGEQPTASAADRIAALASADDDTRPSGSPPTDIPGYEILGEIDRGGMGVVYRARQVRLNREVALKVVLHADPKALVRFLAEAEAIAAVRHPHVVQVFDSGQHAGRPFLAMELCPGGTLATRLKAGKLAPRVAAELLAKVADGVGAAHTAGVVHRDLKPGNVLFDAAGEPKVADFGLAKRGTGADLTRTDAVMGTPAYMAPEQASGGTKFVGPQADVWALGVMLYETLTGARPFDAADPMALLVKVMAAEPAQLRSVSREVPRELDLIAHKCLAKEPAERYATANELAADLRNWLSGRPITAKPAGTVESAIQWVRRNKLVAGATAAVIGAMAVGTGVSIRYAIQAKNALAERDEAVVKEKAIARKFLTFVSKNPDLHNLNATALVDKFRESFPDISRDELIAAFQPAERGSGVASSYAPNMFGD
jgi:tRNA A-37 threonylcarbamoyl transferase component Bud32